MCLLSWRVQMEVAHQPRRGKRWAHSKGIRVSAFITSIPVHVLLRAEHYYQDKLRTLCISVNNWSRCFPRFLKHRAQNDLIWKGPVEVRCGASLWSHHLLRAGTASTTQRFATGSHSVRSEYLQGRRLYNLSGQPAPVLCPRL